MYGDDSAVDKLLILKLSNGGAVLSRILITGGTGFVGGNLSHKLVQDGHEVIIIDDLTSGHLVAMHPKCTFVEGSILDEIALAKCFTKKIDYVIHLAALFANQNSVDHPEKDLTVNGLGTLKILEWSQKSDVKKMLYASSSCVYGNSNFMDESNQVFDPDTPYAITKLLGERYVKFWANHYGLDVVSVRLFNVYGPGDYPGLYRSVIPNFIKLALSGEPLVITGTGSETRDFCYVDDVVAGICAVLFSNTNPAEVFNIASGKTTSIIKMAETINECCGNQVDIVFTDRRSWDQVTDRKAETNKISSLIQLNTVIAVEDGIKRTCDWVRTIV